MGEGTDQPTAAPKRRRWWIGGVVALTAVAVAAGVGVGVLVAGDDAKHQPAAAEAEPTPTSPDSGFPTVDPEVAAATLAYLEGDGAVLLTMHTAATDLPPDVTDTTTCQTVIDELNNGSNSDLVAAAAAGVPDQVLSAVLFEQRSALNVALTRCATPTSDPAPDDLRPLEEVTADVQTRLDELEAAR